MRRLATLLGNPQAILVHHIPDSDTWRVVTAINVSRLPQQVNIDTGLLTRLTENNSADYVAFSADDCPAEDLFYQVFDTDHVIENFPVWQGGQLIGFVAFASKSPLIEQTKMRLIKAAVRALVNLP